MVTPTRELALQVSKDLTVAARSTARPGSLTVYGGVGYDTQLDALAAGSRSSSAPRDGCSTWPTAARWT